MPSPYGNFTKSTLNHNQPNTKALNYFALQFITDAIVTSAIPGVNTAKAFLWDQNPNFQLIKNADPAFTTLITVSHDFASQELLTMNWREKGGLVPFWWWAIDIHTTMEATPANNNLISDVNDELVNLLTKNTGVYTNSINQGAGGVIYNTTPSQNLITENQIFKEGQNPERPNFVTSVLTTIMKVYLGD